MADKKKPKPTRMYAQQDDDLNFSRDADETTSDSTENEDSDKSSEDFIPTEVSKKGKVRKLMNKGTPKPPVTKLHSRM